MILGTLVVNRLRANEPFRAGAGPNGGEFFLPWRSLRERFAREGIELNTPDVNAGRPVAFELHLNAQRQVDHPRSYAYLYEDPIVRPINGDRAALARYAKVFTSNEDLVDGARILRLDYPNDLTPREVPAFGGRDLFCVMIASNKALLHPHPRNLHQQRVDTVRFFERRAPERFSLFGHGWDIPAVRPGAWGRLVKRMNEWKRRWRPDGPPSFPSWKGTLARKHEILDRARFSICYENSRGSPGYLSEKIFDCFTSGCVPVYIGTTHAVPPIPGECYIDADTFASLDALLAYLEGVDAPRFAAYQAAIRAFLSSAQAQRFTNRHWCDTLARTVVADLGAAAAVPAP